jgi:LysM repeat protein
MNVELLAEQLRYHEKIFDTTEESINENDIIIPDYLPDASKIIKCHSTVFIQQKNPSADSISIRGEIAYYILYIPENSCCLKSIIVRDNLEHTFSAPGAVAGTMVFAQGCIAHCECRLINSRKISIRSVAEISTCAYNPCMVVIPTDIEKAPNTDVETKNGQMDLSVTQSIEELNFNVSEDLELPSTKLPIADLLYTDATISLKDIKNVSNKIIIKACAMLKTVYVSNIDQEKVHEVENEIPFSQIIDVANGEDDQTLMDVSLQITSLSTEVAEDQNGENKIILCNLGVLAQVKVERNLSMNILKDAFATNGALKLEQKNLNIEKVLEQTTNQMTIKDVMPISSNGEDIGEVLDLSAKITTSSTETDKQALQVMGAIEVNALCFANEQYYTLQKQIPFQHQQKLPAVSDKIRSEAKVNIISISYNINMSGEMELRILCDIHTKTMILERESVVSGAHIMENATTPNKRAALVLYYPQKNDTLWEIAKRYGVKMSDIRNLNKLDENVQEVTSMLMIPSSAM